MDSIETEEEEEEVEEEEKSWWRSGDCWEREPLSSVLLFETNCANDTSPAVPPVSRLLARAWKSLELISAGREKLGLER